jgi:hypothetical protein
MALQLRPNCEYCDKDLPPASLEARVCSYECTFCADCVDNKLQNVCPNCGGGFVPRPIRPSREWRPGACVTRQLPSDKRVHLKYSLDDIAAHSAGALGPHRHSGSDAKHRTRDDRESHSAGTIVPSTSPKPTR